MRNFHGIYGPRCNRVSCRECPRQRIAIARRLRRDAEKLNLDFTAKAGHFVLTATAIPTDWHNFASVINWTECSRPFGDREWLTRSRPCEPLQPD